MATLLTQIFKFISLLNSETGTHQIATGIVCGFILGMTPVLSLQSLLVFAIIFVFRVQVGAALVSAFFFKFIAFVLDPAFAAMGTIILTHDQLEPLFTKMYNMPIIPFTRFNNTVVMGSGVLSILLIPFVYFLSIVLVKKYRKTVVERFKESRFFKALKATSIYKWYVKYEEYYG